jgi:hypothetical protein
MKTELRLFGRQIQVATKAGRRRLVALFYGAFAGLMLLSWFADATGHSASFWTAEFTILVSPLLGGYLSGWRTPFSAGLIKPFGGNELIRYSSTLSRNSILARIYPKPEDLQAIRNDERELNQRDRAHFLAWRVLSGLVMAAFLLDYLEGTKLHVLQSAGVSAHACQAAIFAILQIGYNLSLTLPAAIILWSEPDLDPDPADPALAGAAQ